MLVALRSRRQIAPFSLHRPETAAEAVALRQAPGASAFLGGGTDLIDWLKYGHAIDRLIRLDGIPGLAEIAGDAAALRIGAMATHDAIAESPVLAALLPDLPQLWRSVANPRVRFAGTLGGNVMAGNADYDGLPALLAVGAQAELASADGSACVPLADLPYDGAALLTGFVIPAPGTLLLFADRSLRPALSVWLGLTVEADRVKAVRVAVGMSHPIPPCVTLATDLRLAELGAASADLAAAVLDALPPPRTDGRAGAAYRCRMAGVLARRILVRAGGLV
jgi:CO/xanthine dehydrogenase FAD-binding subunit